MNMKSIRRTTASILAAVMAMVMTASATAVFAQPAAQALEEREAIMASVGDASSVEDFVKRLYANLLGREADQSGLENWMKALNDGTATGSQAVVGFVNSKEFKTNPLGNEDFVKALYQTIFGREADEGGLTSWVSVLENGCTRKKVLEGFLNSGEMKALCEKLGIQPGSYESDEPADVNYDVTRFVTRLYTLALGRSFDASGVSDWTGALISGTHTGADVAKGFLLSEEFKARGLDDESFVRIAYKTILDREADESGLASWKKALEDNSTEDVVNGFIKSVEFARLCKSYGIDAGTDIYNVIKESPSIKTFPCSTTEEFTALFKKQAEKTPDKIYYHPYTGLFVEAVNADALSSSRELYTYIADQTPHCASSVFVAIPNGELPESFLVKSGWVALADRYHFLLHALTPSGSWGEESEELAYMAAAFAMGTRTVNYSPYTGNYYFVGYDKGGQYLQQYVMANPDNCSGLLVFNGSDIPDAYYEKMAKTAAADPAKTVAEVNVPVWLAARVFDKDVERNYDYWAKANDVDETVYYVAELASSTKVQNQSMLSTEDYINSYPLGKIQLTTGEMAYDNAGFTEIAWETFLSKTQRYRSLAGNDLRPAFDAEALGITKEERTIDGYSRYWLEYVPEHVKNNQDEAVPLVIALHGAGQCAEAYAPYSEWFKVAKEANFIVVFPTAYPYSENNGMARPIHNDCWDENRPDDISFWRQIIQDVSSRYNVDASMVYATGHSNGGNSSAMIAGEMSDVITAVGISAGRYRNVLNKVTEDVSTLHPMASTYKVPVIQLVGTKDGGAYRSATMISTMEYWMERNEIVNRETPYQYKTAGYNHAVWVDKDGVPMVRFTVIDDKIHTTTPSESRLFWYEFLSHYKRAEDGTVKYMADDSFTITDKWDMETR